MYWGLTEIKIYESIIGINLEAKVEVEVDADGDE